MTTPFTYLVGWSKLDRWYYGSKTAVGCHPDDLWSTYFTSSDTVIAFRLEHGEPDVIRKRQFKTGRQAIRCETRVLNVARRKGHWDRWLNRAINGHQIGPKSDEHRAKISRARTGTKMSDEQKLKLSQKLMGSVVTEETKQKISKTLSGRPRSDEVKRKISESRKGIKFTAEHRAAISAANRARTAMKNGIKT